MNIDNPYTLSGSDVLKLLESSENGLEPNQIKDRLEKFGFNEIHETQMKNVLLIFLEQFKNPFIYLLLIATIISASLNEMTNAYFIVAVLIFNSAIGAYQEYSAQNATLSLKQMLPHVVKVIRSGSLNTINSRLIVVGDIVKVSSGDKVPADIRLINNISLSVNESMLTGESIPVNKDFAAEVLKKSTLGDHFNMLYSGTIITSGTGTGVVVATGPSSILGKIASSVIKDESSLPLARTIHAFTIKISLAILIVISLFLILAMLKGAAFFDVLLLGVALAVSIIPESLPAVVTIALAIGMRRLASVNVIVRQLLAVESLGACNLIACDKTGTLTINELTIQEVILSDGSKYKVSGLGLQLQGSIVPDTEITNSELLDLLCKAAVLTSEATLTVENNMAKAIGDTVDLAFLILAYKNGVLPDIIQQEYRCIGQINYESHLAYSAKIVELNNKKYLFVKGSPEKLLTMCDFDDKHKYNLLVKQSAESGFKVLSLAMKMLNTDDMRKPIEHALNSLTWLGFVGMIDPIRPGVIQAIAQCKIANIDVRIITGDHPATASSIAHQLGIVNSMKAVTGQQLKIAISDGISKVEELVANVHVFARIEPQQKFVITDALMRLGYCVAVTGDGANDAPALKHADVGVAMGKRGSDVARENADIILVDDNFSSIINGIAQGRLVYANIKKAAYLMVTTGLSELIVFLICITFGLPMPLTAVQLLWLNLVIGGVQGISLAFEPLDGDEMQRPPRGRNDPFLDKYMTIRIWIGSSIIAVLATLCFIWTLENSGSLELARNNILLFIIIAESMLVINCRSELKSLFSKSIFSNKILLIGIVLAQGIHILAMYMPAIGGVLQIQPVNIYTWAPILALTVFILIFEELYKLFQKSKLKQHIS